MMYKKAISWNCNLKMFFIYNFDHNPFSALFINFRSKSLWFRDL